VSGTEEAWDLMLMHMYPLAVSTLPVLTPEQVLKVLPIAHFYGIPTAMDDCLAAAANFTYTFDGNSSATSNPLPFISMSERLQVMICC
jgi:hypothetical protein